jgi:hypothetical protein
MGCIHIHIRDGKILKVAHHSFSPEKPNGVLHLEDTGKLSFFDYEEFQSNHYIDEHELSDIPFEYRYKQISAYSGKFEGVTLCPTCEVEIKFKINLSGTRFVGVQTFNILEVCEKCKHRWVSEVKVVVDRLPTYHQVDGYMIPDQRTARQLYLDKGLKK